MARTLHIFLDESGTPNAPQSRSADGLFHLSVGAVATFDAPRAAVAWQAFKRERLPSDDGGRWPDAAFLTLAEFLARDFVVPFGSYAWHRAEDFEAAEERIDRIIAVTGRERIAPANLAWLHHMFFVIHRVVIGMALLHGRADASILVFHSKTMKAEHWKILVASLSALRAWMGQWWRGAEQRLDPSSARTAAKLVGVLGADAVVDVRQAPVGDEPLVEVADAVAALTRRAYMSGSNTLARASVDTLQRALNHDPVSCLLFADDGDSFRKGLREGIEKEIRSE